MRMTLMKLTPGMTQQKLTFFQAKVLKSQEPQFLTEIHFIHFHHFNVKLSICHIF